MAPSKNGASVHLSGAPPSSGNFEALKHLLKLNVLQTKLLGELAPQHFDFFAETCQFIEKQVTRRRGWQALMLWSDSALCTHIEVASLPTVSTLDPRLALQLRACRALRNQRIRFGIGMVSFMTRRCLSLFSNDRRLQRDNVIGYRLIRMPECDRSLINRDVLLVSRGADSDRRIGRKCGRMLHFAPVSLGISVIPKRSLLRFRRWPTRRQFGEELPRRFHSAPIFRQLDSAPSPSSFGAPAGADHASG